MNESFSDFRNSRPVQLYCHVKDALVGPGNSKETATAWGLSLAGIAALVFWLLHFNVWHHFGNSVASWFGFFDSGSQPTASTVNWFALGAMGVFFLLTLMLLFGISLASGKSLVELLGERQRQKLWQCVRIVLAANAIWFAVYWTAVFLKRGFGWITKGDATSQAGYLAVAYALAAVIAWLSYKYYRKHKPREKEPTLFKATGLQYMIALVTAVWWGYGIIYPIVIQNAYSNLERAYATSNIFVDALATDAFERRDQRSKIQFVDFLVTDAPATNSQDAPEQDKKAESGIAEDWQYIPSEKDQELLFRFLRYSGLVAPTMSKDDFLLDEQLSQELPFFLQTSQDVVGTSGVSGTNSNSIAAHVLPTMSVEEPKGFSTVKLIVGLVNGMFKNPNIKFEEYLQASLAGSPRFYTDFQEQGESHSDTNTKSPVESTQNKFVPTNGFLAYRPLGVPEARPSVDIISQLRQRINVDVRTPTSKSLFDLREAVEAAVDALGNASSAGGSTAPSDASPADVVDAAPDLTVEAAETTFTVTQTGDQPKPDAQAAVRAYQRFQFFDLEKNQDLGEKIVVEAVARMHSDAGVKWARGYIALVQGLEQVSMLVLALFMLTLLCLRFRQVVNIKKNKEWNTALSNVVAAAKMFSLNTDHGREKPPELFARIRRVNFDGRWVMRWIAQALPAIGFIGTVRGISNGLGSADAIVRAENVMAQAAAINQVAGQLGVAFTTTLIALILGLILGLFERLEASCENKLLSELENASSLQALDTEGE